MPAAVRLGDICSGHGDFPPRKNIEASPNVRINGLGVHTVGDGWDIHCDSQPTCHGAVLSVGSSKVRVNGKPVARIGDAISCGSVCATGSPNVNIG